MRQLSVHMQFVTNEYEILNIHKLLLILFECEKFCMNHESLIVADTSCLEPVLIKCPLQLSKITNIGLVTKNSSSD